MFGECASICKSQLVCCPCGLQCPQHSLEHVFCFARVSLILKHSLLFWGHFYTIVKGRFLSNPLAFNIWQPNLQRGQKLLRKQRTGPKLFSCELMLSEPSGGQTKVLLGESHQAASPQLIMREERLSTVPLTTKVPGRAGPGTEGA